jgi:ATP-dependent RNA helicase DDX19/DBP5
LYSPFLTFQVLLFSATFNEMVKAFIPKVVRNANEIYVKKEELTLDKLKQYNVWCPDELAKIEVIRDRIFEFGQKVGQTIIFVRTRESTKMLQSALTSEGYECTAIQGALKQEDRDKIIQEFKGGLTKVLITTDLLARGFDQAQVVLTQNML